MCARLFERHSTLGRQADMAMGVYQTWQHKAAVSQRAGVVRLVEGDAPVDDEEFADLRVGQYGPTNAEPAQRGLGPAGP